jgi:ferrochelatase
MNGNAKVGILLVNLGTPDTPTPSGVRRFLKPFLSDSRVIDLPKLPWRLLLNTLILPIRSPKVAKSYQTIWLPEGAPLRVSMHSLATKLCAALNTQDHDTITVTVGMQYGNPNITESLLALQEKGIEQLVVLPLYPQYSSTTTAAVFDAIGRTYKTYFNVPAIHFIRDYHTHPLYITALADSIRAQWAKQGRAQKLIMSFHGIPKRYADKGDPYPRQCEATAQLLANALGLAPDEWMLCYQSRFGKAEWLKPYLINVLETLPSEGIRSIDIISPGFSIDCLETLDELAIVDKKIFLDAGGEQYHYIPALNDSDAQVLLLTDILRVSGIILQEHA